MKSVDGHVIHVTMDHVFMWRPMVVTLPPSKGGSSSSLVSGPKKHVMKVTRFAGGPFYFVDFFGLSSAAVGSRSSSSSHALSHVSSRCGGPAFRG